MDKDFKIQIEVSKDIIGNVFGKLDKNVTQIENTFSVNILNREGYINIIGNKELVIKASQAIKKLVIIAKKGEEITEQTTNYIISNVDKEEFTEIEELIDEKICLTYSGKPIKPKTIGQKKYIKQISENTIVFGVGPAGTGKTYLAIAMAITEFKRNNISRIILTRPAIEAGESLGFLPGDLQQKVDPYLRPLYDALFEIMGAEAFQKNMEKGTIEVAPLAYMRGRTLDNAFIILDEAQNTTPEQMKMFLTRIGFGSKVVITGDVTQIDLPSGKKSGLVEAIKILQNVNDLGISHLSKEDIVRHPLVQKIIEAYDKYEKKTETKIINENNKDNRNRKFTAPKQ